MTPQPHLFVLTYCRSPELLYGNLLVFGSIRVGWPTATVTVVDNCSTLEARREIEREARRVGANFVALDHEIKHHSFIQRVIEDTDHGAIAISDPDVIYWSSMQDLHFDGLMAGRLIPAFFDNRKGAITAERLHTSLLVIPDVQALKAKLAELPRVFFEYCGAAPCAYFKDGRWFHYDTMGVAYAALKAHCQPFSERELDCYDHIFCGTHLDIVGPQLDRTGSQMLAEIHAQAKGDPSKLRGLWRQQEAYLRACSIEHLSKS